MPVTLKDNQGTSFSSAIAFGDKTTSFEFAATDDNADPTAAPAFWLKIGFGGVDHIVWVPEETPYADTFPGGRADNWTWSVKADTDTADITLKEV